MNGAYAKGREGRADGSLVWTSATIKAAIVRKGTYAPNFDDDEYVSDVTDGGATVVTDEAVTLSSKTVDAGALDAADLSFTAFPAGEECDALLVYEDTGTASTSRLLFFFDDVPGVPFTPDGTDVAFAWNNGVNKIARV